MLKPPKTITRKQLKRDPLIETLYRLRQWWLARSARISRFGGIALIVVVLAVLVTRWRGSQDAKAASVVGISFVEYSRGNYNTVIAQLNPYVEEYRGLSSFGSGLYLLARSELHAGDSAGAEEHFQTYLDEYGGDPLLKSSSLAGLGIIAEGGGRYSEAGELLRKASRAAPTPSLQQRFAVLAARNLLLAGVPGEALELLEPLLEDADLEFRARGDILGLVASAKALLEAAPDS